MKLAQQSALGLWQRDLTTLLQSPLAAWVPSLTQQLVEWHQAHQHGELKKWLRTVDLLPNLAAAEISLADTVQIGPAAATHEQAKLTGLLKQLMPWRKGPFDVFGVSIDTEWRSDLKWQRLLPHISDLRGRHVLDVGCGSGYHLWRMLEAGAAHAWGIDPGQLFMAQFFAIQKLMSNDTSFASKDSSNDSNDTVNASNDIASRAHFFPLGVEQLPTDVPHGTGFDTVFSMGVLYHRRSPIDFLSQLHQQLRKGGELVLETLVVDGDQQTVLVPGERYAKMRNVWFLPSCDALVHWLTRVGFQDVRVVDVAKTTFDEQRRTEWMTGESLFDFIDPNDNNMTIEGYQAPTRAVLLATKS